MTPIKSMQSNSSVFSKALATLSVPRAAADPASGRLRVAGKVRKELVCGGDYSTFFFYRKLIRLLSGARQQQVAMWFSCVGVVLKVF